MWCSEVLRSGVLPTIFVVWLVSDMTAFHRVEVFWVVTPLYCCGKKINVSEDLSASILTLKIHLLTYSMVQDII
jgi:hypothetical protein